MIPPELPPIQAIAPEEAREEERFLLQGPEQSFLSGPNSRWHELCTLFGVMFDFIRGFRKFHFVGPCVTIFGSARVKENEPFYALTMKVAASVADLGFTIMTGGGPGLMEAANRGAREAGGRSVGINIRLPHEQKVNPYVDVSADMKYFFTRKTLLIKYSYAFIVMPGGMGTMDELYEALTLIQCGKIRNFPVILIGCDYWQPTVSVLERMREERLISPSDLDLLTVTDDLSAAMEILKEKAIGQFSLRRIKAPHRWPWLGE